MKNILKITLFTTLLALTSCAHYGKCCKSHESQCEMKQGWAKDQCPMKKEEAAPAKK